MQFGMGLVARGKHHLKLGKTSDSWVYCNLLLILHCLTLLYDRHSLEKMAFTRAVHATTCHVDSSTRQLQPTNMDEFALFSENYMWYQCTIAWTSSHPNPWVLGDKGKVRYLKIFTTRAAAWSSDAFVFFSSSSFFRLLALVSFCWFFTSATMI